ncbi:MAG: P44/Msp2 family outer membrane protein [Chlorobiaceae bacterium]
MSGDVPGGLYAASLKPRTGVSVDGAVGCNLGSIRVEESVGYQNNSIGGTATTTSTGYQEGGYQAGGYQEAGTSTTRALSGDISVSSVMTNVYKDFQVSGVDTYVTAGCGAAIVNVNKVSDGVTNINHQKTLLAYQFGLGCCYSFTPSVKMNLNYQFTPGLKTNLPELGSSELKITAHKIKIGISCSI